MKRRSFFTHAATGTGAALLASCTSKTPEAGMPDDTPHTPLKLAGMSIEDLRDDYRKRLFDRYLPFWDNGAFDDDIGGVMCNLNDDGTVAEDEKFIWFQGRSLWVYAYLYNNFGQDRRWLERAVKMRDFIVTYMNAGNGRWYERMNRDGSVREGVSKSLYGWAFIAEGLQELYQARGDERDLAISRETLKAMRDEYESPMFGGVANLGGYPETMDFTGHRAQGIHMCFLNILRQMLQHTDDEELKALQREQVDIIMKRFYNPEFGLTNEYLHHDWSRIQGYDDYMLVGHSIEVQWMLMLEAVRLKDSMLFESSKNLIRRYIEMGWDYVFDGLGATHFYVFDGENRTREKLYGVKEGWAHTEVLIALMHVIEYSGEEWATLWYNRAHAYIMERFDTPCGVWKQSINRYGGEVDQSLKIRSRWHPTRKDNFHQPRALMMNLLSLERMIQNKGAITNAMG